MDPHSFHSPLAHFDATALLDALGVPLLVLDPDCCVSYANVAARRLLRLGLDRLQGRPLDHLFLEGLPLRRQCEQMLRAPEGAGPLQIPSLDLAEGSRRLRLKAFAVDGLTGPHLIVQLGRVRLARARPVLSLVANGESQLECA